MWLVAGESASQSGKSWHKRECRVESGDQKGVSYGVRIIVSRQYEKDAQINSTSIHTENTTLLSNALL